MSINFNTDNSIVLDGEATGLRYAQQQEGTVIFSVEHGGSNYQRYPMPHSHYALPQYRLQPKNAQAIDASDVPAGRHQFEADLRALFLTLKSRSGNNRH